MNVEVLRSATFGGYDKADVIMTLDTLNPAKFAFEERAISLSELKRISNEISEHQFKKVFTGGFNKQDVENYIRSLCDEIQNISE